MATAVNTSTQQYFGFDPRTIPGCVLWMDAADRNVMFSDTGRTTLATLGGTVVRWNDKSGFSNHVTASSGTTTLTASAINQLPALSFASSWFTGGFSSTYTGNQLRGFAVATLASGSGAFARIFSLGRPGVNDFNATDTTFLFIRNAGGQNIMVGRNNSYLGVNIPGYSTPFLIQAGHASNIESIAVNGALIPSPQNTGVSGNFNITSYGIGTNTNTADIQPFIGLIGEIIYYTENLTTAQIQQVEGYLAWKWGLQANLPVGHAFKNNPTTMRVFRPIDIDSCALWLDAADASTILPSNITSGTAITRWNDKSSNATSAVPQRGASGVAPVFSNVGGVPSIFVNNGGVNANYNASTYAQLQLQTNIQTTQDYSVFAVINFNTFANSPDNQTIYSNRRGGVERAPQFGPGSTFESTSTGTFRQILSGFLGTGIRQTSLVSSLASLVQLSNGAPYASVVSNLANRFTTDADPLPTIGGTFSSVGQDNRFTTGHFHELILYNKALSTSERQQVEGYLAEKWRTPALPTTQPYFSQRALPSIPIFSPTAAPGLQLWLDSADSSAFTLSGSNVTQWTDKSGNNRHGVPPAVSNQPTYNGDGVLFSAGGFQYLPLSNVSGMLTNFAFNVFVVERNEGTYPQASGEGFFLASETPGDNQAPLFGYQTTTQAVFATWGAPAGNDLVISNIPSSTTPRLWSFNMPQTSNRNVNIFGTLVATHTNSTKLSGMPNLSVGRAVGGNYYRGRIYEILIYRGGMTPAQIQQVEGYLAWKWGLQTRLPTGPTFDPASVGPAIWLDAADASTFTLSGSNVSEWRDKSGNARHYAQANASFRPTFRQNGVNTTGNQVLTNSADLRVAGRDIFVVGTPLTFANRGVSGWRTLLRGSTSEHPIIISQSGTALGCFLEAGSFNQYGSLVLDGENRSLIYVNTTPATLRGPPGIPNAALNGTIRTSAAANTVAATTNFFALGNIDGGGQPWGEINELIIISNTTSDQRRQIEEYLALKWGVQLPYPVIHPFSKFRP